LPTYDYECLACAHKFELFQQMIAKPIKKCPKCKANKAKRLIGSGMGIIFKGSGFYETDYKRKEPKNNSGKKINPSTEGATQKPQAKKDSSSDAKPQAKKTESSSKGLGKDND